MQSDCCPHCGHPIRDEAADAIERMRQWCREHSVTIDFDDSVSTADAEKLAGYSAGTLRNQRSMGIGPPFIRRGGRCRYRIADLAIYFCAERNKA